VVLPFYLGDGNPQECGFFSQDSSAAFIGSGNTDIVTHQYRSY